MNKSLYGEDEGQSAPPPDEHENEQEQENAGKPVLINKEAFPNVKPGERITLEIVRDHGDELECRPVEEEQEPAQQEMEEQPDGKPGLYD
jgi:hypothetical protein